MVKKFTYRRHFEIFPGTLYHLIRMFLSLALRQSRLFEGGGAPPSYCSDALGNVEHGNISKRRVKKASAWKITNMIQILTITCAY